MKAVVYNGEKIAIQDVPKPVPTATQALIRLKAAGVCGTDLAIIKGYLPTPKPLILGHELTGEVVEVGKNVDPKWIGKRVTCEINSNICGKCFYCVRNNPTQCVTRKALGIDINGGWAEYIAVESYLLHEFPSSLDFGQATFIEPLAAAYQTFETMPLGPDDKIMAIFGMGKLGLLILQVARVKNLKTIAIDASDAKLQLAKSLGATYTINRLDFKDKVPVEIKKLTADLGADIVVDCSGHPKALVDVVKSTRTRGKIHMKSTHGLATPVNITDIVVREITVYSSRCGPFEKAIAGLQSGDIKVDGLISKVFPLDQIHEAVASYDESRDHIKTLLTI
jgi:alcohol dehydrogenase